MRYNVRVCNDADAVVTGNPSLWHITFFLRLFKATATLLVGI